MVFSTYSSMEIGFTVAIFSLFLGHYPSLARSLSVIFSIVVMSAVLLCTRRKADFGTFRYEIEYGMYFVVALLMLAKSWEHYAIFLLFPECSTLLPKKILTFLAMPFGKKKAGLEKKQFLN